MTALRELVLIRTNLIPGSPPATEWSDEWFELFQELYYTCRPVQFPVRAIQRGTPDMELNSQNYISLYMEKERLKQGIDDNASINPDSSGQQNGPETWVWLHDGCSCLQGHP